MKTIDFLDILGTPHRITTEKNSLKTFLPDDPFSGYTPSALELIDYTMEMAVIDEYFLSEGDKPIVLQHLLAIKDMIDPSIHWMSGLYELVSISFLEDNFETPIDAAKHLHALWFAQQCIVEHCRSFDFDPLRIKKKSDLTSSIFGGSRYIIKLPDSVCVELANEMSEPGATLYVKQDRFHLSENASWGYTFKAKLFENGHKNNDALGESKFTIPCYILPKELDSEYAKYVSCYNIGSGAVIDVPVDLITGTLDYRGVNDYNHPREIPYQVPLDNGNPLRIIDVGGMKHNLIKSRINNQKEAWIKKHKAEHFEKSIMSLTSAQFLEMKASAISLKKMTLSKSSIVRWLRNNHDLHPAVLFGVSEELRSIDMMAPLLASHRSFLSSNYRFRFDDALALNRTIDLQALLNEMVSLNVNMFREVPAEFESLNMGKSIEKYGVIDLKFIFKAASNIFSDAVIIQAAQERVNSFKKIKDIPAYLVTEGNLPAILGKNGFDPAVVLFDLDVFMSSSNAIAAQAMKLKSVKNWISSKKSVFISP